MIDRPLAISPSVLFKHASHPNQGQCLLSELSTTSPCNCYKKCMKTIEENLYVDIGTYLKGNNK